MLERTSSGDDQKCKSKRILLCFSYQDDKVEAIYYEAVPGEIALDISKRS
jgi:hypothetical protein